ncbi:MAG: hypothetical protein H7339_14960 [Arcicella sp.]|nr:hypothetical protein [Arcicella sp.]
MTTNQDFTQSSGGNNGKSNRFYNTIGAAGTELKKSQRQTETQENKILALLEKYPNEEFTKHEVKTHLVNMGKIHERTPESSISRALTDLMNDGKVVKLDKMRMGEFGKPNHLWKLKIILTIGTQAEIF